MDTEEEAIKTSPRFFPVSGLFRMNNANRRLWHCLRGRRKILELRGPDLINNGSDRYVDTGPDNGRKEFSLFLSFFWERLISSRRIYVQAALAHSFPFQIGMF
jgi:hypothetical protein